MQKRNFLKNTIIGGFVAIGAPSLLNSDEKLGYININNLPNFPDGTKAHCGDIKLTFENKIYEKEAVVEANDKEGWFVSIGQYETEYRDGVRCSNFTEHPEPVKFSNINFRMELKKLEIPHGYARILV